MEVVSHEEHNPGFLVEEEMDEGLVSFECQSLWNRRFHIDAHDDVMSTDATSASAPPPWRLWP